jgi:hypothetical protein
MVETYPESVAARVLHEMLELSDEDITTRPGFATDLKRERAKLKRTIVAIQRRRQVKEARGALSSSLLPIKT